MIFFGLVFIFGVFVWFFGLVFIMFCFYCSF